MDSIDMFAAITAVSWDTARLAGTRNGVAAVAAVAETEAEAEPATAAEVKVLL